MKQQSHGGLSQLYHLLPPSLFMAAATPLPKKLPSIAIAVLISYMRESTIGGRGLNKNTKFKESGIFAMFL